MPINRYSIRNVYSLADPELYKAADKDDPEALLEGVAMAGLVGLLRQLGDLAEFAAEIFHELHEEVMATAARGHGLLVRVQQLESEIPLIEKAYLSQTSHSAFFPNPGIDWHPTRQTTQNLITTGDLPRFVMGSYEECRGPPRLFLLDKFDVGGAGACLKRYTDPSVFKVEASSYEIETAETQRDKRIRKNKKKGSRWNGGETPDVSQPSHVKLHQLFLEERVQTGALEPARRVKLKKRPNNSPFDSGSGESYMNKVINSPLDLESEESYVKKLFRSPLEDKDVHEGVLRSLPLTLTSDTSKESRLEIPDDNIMGSALGSPMQSKSPCVSSSLEKTAYEGPTDDRLKTEIQEEVDEKQIAVDEEIKTDGFQNGYISDDMASETDNYMDPIAPMDSERDMSINHRTYFDANKDQLQSQLSDSRSIESLTVSDDGNSSITKNITMSVDSDTASTSTGNTSPVGADLPPQPFACIEIPFRPRVPPVAEKILMIEHLDNDVTSDACIDVRKELYISSEADSAPHVDQVAMLEEGTSNKTDSNEVSLNDVEILDSPKRSEVRQGDLEVAAECTSEHSDFLPTPVDDLSSFLFVRNLKGVVDDKYPNDTSIPMIPLPNILDSNEVQYVEENHRKDSVDSRCSSPHSVTSHADTAEEQPSDIHDVEADPSDNTFCDDVPVAEETADRSGIYSLPEHHLKEVGDGESPKYDSAEAAVSYSSKNETESNNLELEVVTCAVSDLAAKEETELEEREIESGNTVSVPDNVDRNDGKDLGDDTELEGRDVDVVHSDMQTSVAFSSPVDVDKHEDNGCSSLEDRSVINHLCILQDSKESGEHVEVDQLLVISTDPENDVDCPSLNSKISQDHRKQEAVLHDLGSQPVDDAPCDLSTVLLLDGTPDSTVSTEVVHNVDSKSLEDKIDQPNDQIDISEVAQSSPDLTVSTEVVHNVDSLSLENKIDQPNDQIDIFEPALSSPGENKVDQSSGQLYARGSQLLSQLDFLTHIDHETLSDTPSEPYQVNLTCQRVAQEEDQGEPVHSQGLQSSPESYPVPVSENPPTTELLQGNTPDVDLSDQVKHQSTPVLSGLAILPQPDSVKKQEAVFHDLGSQPVDVAPCDLSNVLLLDGTPDSTVCTEVVHNVYSKSLEDKIDQPNDQIDIFEVAQSSPDLTVSTEVVLNVDSLSLENKIDQPNDQIDIFEAAQSSPGEDKVDQSSGQLYARGSQVLSQLDFLTHIDHETLSDTPSEPYQVNLTCQRVAQEPVHSHGLQSSSESYPVPVSENSPTTELLQGNTPDVDLSDQVKHQSTPVFSGLAILSQLDSVKQENMPPLPPLPPMQWRMRQPPTDGGQHRDHFTPTFSFTPSEHPQVVDRSTLDEMINLNTVNQKSQHGMGGFNQMLSPESSLHTEDHENLSVSSEARVTQTAVETEHASRVLKISDQEVFGPQSKPYSLPPVVDNISDNFPPVFASTHNEDPQVVGHSRVDETKNLDTENPKSVSQMSLSDSRIHTKDHDKPFVLSEEKFADNLVPEAAAQTTSAQENVRPSSNAYSFPLDVDEMPNNIQPMKILRPRSPLIDAVAAHDKTKLRKVSDRATTQTPKEEEHDTILDQIRAKAFKLKPAVKTRPTSIQGPMTNLRVAAILEKANAIRQAFAGSDDDSDSWSD